MKLLFVSDLHGSLHYGREFERIYQEENPDYLVLLGDLLYHGARNPLTEEYNPKELIPILNKYKDRIIAVRGNCDSEVDQMVLEFEIMGDYSTILVDGIRLFLTHGHKYNAQNLPKLSARDVLVHGHTHLPLAEKTGEYYVFNPGSIALPKGGNLNSYGVYEEGQFRVKALDKSTILELKLD